MNKLKLFQRLVAWLFCLDEFNEFASQFHLKTKNPSNQTIIRSKIALRYVYLKDIDELSSLVLEQD